LPISRTVSPIDPELTNTVPTKNCCDGIDIVISSVGITKQTDGLSYIDVDYQANLNLLNEAQKSGVSKFVYVSVLNGEKLRLNLSQEAIK
jgi:nucleoside-diphosphate-sugar epimerase